MSAQSSGVASKVTRPFEVFQENIRRALADEAELARRQAQSDDPNHVPRQVAWRDDPDPFGMGWAWAVPDEADAR